MKRAATILAVLAGLLLPCALVISGSMDIPHEDPAAAESDYDISLSVLMHYADVVSLLAERKYEDMRAMIEQLDPDRATIPDEVKFAMQTYNGLLDDLADILTTADEKLNQAESLLDAGGIEDARLMLNDAATLAQEARDLLGAIEDVNDQLVSLLGPLAQSVDVDVLDDARQKLEEAMLRLAELEDLYDQILLNLETEAESSQESGGTDVTLELDKTEAWVGEVITVSGTLTYVCGGSTLEGREVMVLLDDATVLTAVTEGDGTYRADLRLPYRYQSVMSVQTKYVPLGEDQGVYCRCLSEPVEINVSFYRTQLDVQFPGEAYPGLALNINGTISYEAGTPAVDRELTVSWDGEAVGSLCPVQGEFEIEFALDAETAAGLHTLNVAAKRESRYSNASADALVSVSKELPDIEIDDVSFNILSRRVRVEGKVTSDLPLGEEVVSVKIGSASTAVETQQGEFEASLTLPVDSVLVGNQKLEIMVEPSGVWHLPVEASTTVFVVDAAKLGLVSVVFVSVGAVLYTRRRTSAVLPDIEVPDEASPVVEAEVAGAPAPLLTIGRERVLRAYAEVADLLQKAAVASASPSTSLREFLKGTEPYLGASAAGFAGLTYLAEEALYAAGEPDEHKIARAEELASTLKESLRHGRT